MCICVCVYMSNYVDICVRETQHRHCPHTQVLYMYIHTQVNNIYIYILVCVYMGNYIDMCVRGTQHRYCPRTQVLHMCIHTQVNTYMYIYTCIYGQLYKYACERDTILILPTHSDEYILVYTCVYGPLQMNTYMYIRVYMGNYMRV